MVAGNEDTEYQVKSGSPLDTRQEGSRNIGNYCLVAALERRGGSGEDPLSVLGNATIRGRFLTDSELAHNGMLYVADGLETTRNAISAGLLALLEHPVQWIFCLNIPKSCRPRSKEPSDWRVR
jgi:cholest-4-en-3-one 26-monooxygenase